MADVVIYTQPWCPYCARAKNLMTTKGIEFREIEAPQGSSARYESIRRSGGRTSVPQIFINDRHVGGSDDLAELDREGRLERLLAAP